MAHPHPPSSRFRKGTADPRFARERAALIAGHEGEYVRRHKLKDAFEGAWNRCLAARPSDPLAFAARCLDPESGCKGAAAAADELRERLADVEALHDMGSRHPLLVPTEEEAELVRCGFEAILASDPYFSEKLLAELGKEAERFRSCGEMLQLLRLLTNNARNPPLAAAHAAAAVAQHGEHGLVGADYTMLAGGMLRVVRRHLISEGRKRSSEVKRSWMRVFAFVSMAMAGAGAAVHGATAEDAAAVAASLRSVDGTSAAASVARAFLDMCPRAETVATSRGSTPDTLGQKLIDGMSLVAHLLSTRGLQPCLDYLRVLGQQHAAWGVTPPMFAALGQAVFTAVHVSLEADTTTSTARSVRAWRKCLDVTVAALTEARANPPPPPPAPPPPPPPPEAVPVTEEHLQVVFRRCLPAGEDEGRQWLDLETVTDVVAAQEAFYGVPVSRQQVRMQIEDIIRRAGGEQDGKIGFPLFCIVMLRLSQR